jgi:F-type H+-transporting ATPase subunit gamma
MPSAKDLKKKIRTVSNTKKITRTMEMVATVKAKQTQDRIKATAPYSEKLAEILNSLAASGSIAHPFLTVPERVNRSLVLIVSANRGLCGAYNTHVLNKAEKWIVGERSAGREVEAHMIGKKGIARFRFRREAVAESYTHIADRPSFKDAEELADVFMQRFLARDVQRVVVFSTRYFSAAVQRPVETSLLPIVSPEASESSASASGEGSANVEGAGGKTGIAEFVFEPNREQILESLLPLSVKNALYRLLIEAAACEQIARRIAMKLATDNAEEMSNLYTRSYNRQRQAGITKQIMEIVGGAEALG